MQAASPWGTAQFSAAYQDNAVGTSSAPLTLELQTGFVMGGGEVKLGMPSVGPAVVLAVIDKPPAALATNQTETPDAIAPNAPGARAALAGIAPQTVAVGSYRVVIDNQPYSLVDVGQKVAIPLQPYKDYKISLQAVGAPPYNFDLTPRDVPAYPGNVVVLHWKAKHVVTIFGRLIDVAGHALPAARVDIGTDTTVTDAAGYFVVTGPNDANVVARTDGGQGCRPVPLSSLRGATDANGLMKVGDVACHTN